MVTTLSYLQDSQISLIIDSLDKEIALNILKNFNDKKDLAEVLQWLNPLYVTYFIEEFGTNEFISVVKSLPYEDIAGIIENLEDTLQHKLLYSFTSFVRGNIERSLSYPEDSVARIMSREMVTVPCKWSVGQALDYVASLGEDENLPEVFYEVYLVDASAKFVGAVRLNSLIGSGRDKLIESLQDKETKALKFATKQETAAQLFKENHLASLPVVDDSGFLIGSVHVDSIVESIYIQYEEDMLMMAGIDNSKSMYKTLFSVASSRLKWLMVNIIGGLVGIPLIVNVFEATLSQKIILAALIPVVNSIGGNIGLQTLSITLRGITNSMITSITVKKHVYKELSITLINSLLVGVIGFFATYVWDGEIKLAVLILIAITINAFCGMFIGVFFPLLFKKLKLDPAIASTLLLTTATDFLGFFIVLGLGSIMLT